MAGEQTDEWPQGRDDRDGHREQPGPGLSEEQPDGSDDLADPDHEANESVANRASAPGTRRLRKWQNSYQPTYTANDRLNKPKEDSKDPCDEQKDRGDICLHGKVHAFAPTT